MRMKGTIKPEVRQLDSNPRIASVWPWATYLITLGFSFPICKRGAGGLKPLNFYVLSKQAIS